MKERKKMGRGAKVLIAAAAVILIVLTYAISIRNDLVKLEQGVKQSVSDVGVTLQRRNDLIPNLVSTVRGYATHEKEVFDAVALAREGMLNAKTMQETVEADAELTQSLGRLLAVAEAYPELKANENFLSLQDELSGTENRIAVARRDFNVVATEYNTKIRIFPRNMVAKMFKFTEFPLFTAQDDASTVPTVNFE